MLSLSTLASGSSLSRKSMRPVQPGEERHTHSEMLLCLAILIPTLADVRGRGFSGMHSGSDEYHSLTGVRLQVVGGADGQNIQSSLLL